jgi:hypothetical protein
MSQNFLDVDMHINDLATFMFLKNVNNAIVELSLGGVENNKDFFYFCLDLFCKGLVILFGENGKVNVESLTQEQFAIIKQKMSLAGIDVKLDVFIEQKTTISLLDDDTAPPDVDPIKTSINFNEIDMDDDNKPLSEYVFRLKMDNLLYNIHFETIHRVL